MGSVDYERADRAMVRQVFLAGAICSLRESTGRRGGASIQNNVIDEGAIPRIATRRHTLVGEA